MNIPNLIKVIKVLQSNDSPRQLAFAISLGAFLGLIPGFNFSHVLLLIVVYLLNINLGLAFLTAFFYKFMGIWIAPVSHRLGEWALTHPAMQDVWTWMYNQPILPWTRFNNTLVIGGFLLAILGFIPHYLIGIQLIKAYRRSIRDRLIKSFGKWKIVKVIKGSKWVKRINKILDLKNVLR